VSPLACGDNHGHPFLLFSRLLQSPFPSRDNRVCWHVETIMVIHFCCFQDYYNFLCLPKTSECVGMRRQSWSSTFIVFKTIAVSFAFQRQASPLECKDNYGHPFLLFSRLLQSPLSSKDKRVRWHAEIIMVFRFCCFQDYCSFPFLLETSESVGMRRQSWSSTFIVFKTITVFFAFQRQASPLACRDIHGLLLSLF